MSLDIICRVCLAPNDGQFLEISAEFIQDGKTVDLVRILEELGGISIQGTNKLPNLICSTCLDEALIARLFREKCQNSEMILKTCITTPNVLIPISDEYSMFYLNKKSKVNKKKSLKESNTKEKLDIQILKTDFRPYIGELTICSENLTIPDDIMIIQNSDNSQFYRQVGEMSNGDVHLEAVDDSEAQLYAAILNQEQSDKQFVKCKLCAVYAFEHTNLLKHLKDKHRIGEHQCSYCGQTFVDLEMIKAHIEKHGKYVCDYCKRHFNLKIKLKAHIERHNDAYDVDARLCVQCDKQFNSGHKYRVHMNTVHTTKSPAFTCHICGVGYTAYAPFRAHLDKHERGEITHDNKSFTCDICGMSFALRSQIALHIWGAHFDRRPHRCAVCGKGFRTKSTLKGHEVVHTRERRFHCHICNVGLVDKRTLIQHVRLHTDTRPFSCRICERGFVSIARLNNHAKTAHSKPTKKCPLCPGLFHLKSMLRSHFKKVHACNEKKARRNRYGNMQVDWEVEEVQLDEIYNSDRMKNIVPAIETVGHVKKEEFDANDFLGNLFLTQE